MEKLNESPIPVPTPQQMEWADCEVGVLIHYDIQVFEQNYKFRKQWGYHPDPKVFAPQQLDTDQWIKTAKAAGAKYAILTAKHCSGFCLWPSENYGYSVKQSSYLNGQGDIIKSFIESCKKYGLKPGLYYSTGCNAFMNFDMPVKGTPPVGSPEFNKYRDLVEQQLREIWGNYGDLFEVWFDGGHFEGGPDIPELLKELQPNAVCFQGPPAWQSNLRWVGNEAGHAPYPCWATITDIKHYDGTKEIGDKHKGDPDGNMWMPAETDTPNRRFQWIWKKYSEFLLVSPRKLVDFYTKSVGRNSNLLLGMVIDNKGLVPERDVKQFLKFGDIIRERFGHPIAFASGEGPEFLIELDPPQKINQTVIQEDITSGELVRQFIIEVYANSTWRKVFEGSCIGHKRIGIWKTIYAEKVRLSILQTEGNPKIRNFAIYQAPNLRNLRNLIKRVFWH